MPKIPGFLWRMLANRLVVANNMSQKRLTKSKECPRCGLEEETVNYDLFTCPYARIIWPFSPMAFLFYPASTDSIYQNMATLLIYDKQGRDDDFVERMKGWPWILWRLWKARNDLCFSNKQTAPEQLVRRAVENAAEWHENQEKPVAAPNLPPRHINIWHPTPQGTFKCNVDASWLENSNRCGVG